jgi:hypothetical protein
VRWRVEHQLVLIDSCHARRFSGGLDGSFVGRLGCRLGPRVPDRAG